MAINREEIRAFFKKSRAAALVLLCGVFLMCLPGGKKETQVAQPAGGDSVSGGGGRFRPGASLGADL